MNKKLIAHDFPNRVEIELTNRCNSECIFCPRRHIVFEEEGTMSMDLFKKIVDEIENRDPMVVQLHRRGESLLNPNFSEMIKYISGKVAEIQIATNGILLDKINSRILAESIDFISFSIDTPKNYLRLGHLGKYEDVENNILYFLEINHKATTQVSLVLTEMTSKADVDEFIEYWRSKVDRIRIYQAHSQSGKFGSLKIGRTNREPCVKPFTDIVIFWNGFIARCNHDWLGYKKSNITNTTISNVWNSADYIQLRSEQLSLNFSDEPCISCESWYAEEGVQNTGIVVENL